MRKLDLNNSNFQELNNSEMTMVKGGKHSMDGNHGNEKTREDYERERKKKEEEKSLKADKGDDWKIVQIVLNLYGN